jgi:hypothetical protein
LVLRPCPLATPRRDPAGEQGQGDRHVAQPASAVQAPEHSRGRLCHNGSSAHRALRVWETLVSVERVGVHFLEGAAGFLGHLLEQVEESGVGVGAADKGDGVNHDMLLFLQ